jgi:hypothetical protein
MPEFSTGLLTLFLCALSSARGDTILTSVDCVGTNGTIHEFSELDLFQEKQIDLSDFIGKVK